MRAADHPDNANPPVTNRPETILGVVITFLVVAFIAISLRLYVRFRARLWSWDDLVVFLAGVSTSIGSSLVCLMPDYGMGKHYWTLDDPTKMEYYKHVWSTNVTYTISTTLIKLAILFQYLRLFDMQSKLARRLTIILIILIAMWGTSFFFLALFSCKPIAKNWNFKLAGTCVAWGSKDPNVFFATWAAHAATNMMWDILVLALPVPFLKGLRVSGKTRAGLIALFTMGGIVVALSCARMIALSIKRAGTVPVFDPSWSTPSIYIFSVLEINIAILCASIPIFWPLVTSLAANKILVVNEVEVRTDRRGSQNIALAEQGGNFGAAVMPDFDMDIDQKVRTSRLSVVAYGKDTPKLIRTASKLTRSPSSQRHGHQRSKPSNTSSTKSIHLGLTGRTSGESQQSLHHQISNGALSLASSSPDQGNALGLSRNGSVTQCDEQYLKDWEIKDFKINKKPNTGNTTTVGRAPIPFDHIKALGK